MPAYLSAELSGTNGASGSVLTSAPVGYKPRATVYQGVLKRLRATFTLSATAVTTSDTLVVGNLPAGATFAFGVINASATMGASATLAIGNATTTGKYRAAAVFTAAAPTLFGPVAAQGAADPDLSAEEQVIVTIAAASLPTSGTLVIDIFYSMPQ
ncbi:MAG: hypothetical protein WCI59_21400 [Betaproteobacteria bacterium]|jgi:hypothetical protein